MPIDPPSSPLPPLSNAPVANPVSPLPAYVPAVSEPQTSLPAYVPAASAPQTALPVAPALPSNGVPLEDRMLALEQAYAANSASPETIAAISVEAINARAVRFDGAFALTVGQRNQALANLGMTVNSSASSVTLLIAGGALGTPASGTLSNCTGLPVAGLEGLASGIAQFLADPTSANLANAVTDETGGGPLMFRDGLVNQCGLLVYRSIVTTTQTVVRGGADLFPFGSFTMNPNKTYRISLFIPVGTTNGGRVFCFFTGSASVAFKSFFTSGNLNIELSNGNNANASSNGLLQPTGTSVFKVEGMLRTTSSGSFSFLFQCDLGTVGSATASVRAGACLEIYEIE